MALNLAQKEKIVAEVAQVAQSAYSAIGAEYRGLSVEQLTKLRVEARKVGVYVRVIKNTLARRALQDTAFECMQNGLTGPLILAFSQTDPGAAARVMQAFAKDHDKFGFQVRLVAFGGELLDPSAISKLATLPTYDQAISLLMATMKAPVQKLAATILAIQVAKEAEAA
ncbi:50S ribosomal protein L10 [Chromatium weissei]|nr:50S ribosomal protein L10 [Chromatium weissei]